WIARETDGFVTYPRPVQLQRRVADEYRAAASAAGVAPRLAQSLYIDLLERRKAPPRPIHLGWALGREPLVELLEQTRALGVGHVVLNLKYGTRPAAEVVEELGAEVLPRLGGTSHDLPVLAAMGPPQGSGASLRAELPQQAGVEIAPGDDRRDRRTSEACSMCHQRGDPRRARRLGQNAGSLDQNPPPRHHS